ncbi:TPA: zinc-binding dehydrogenase, partial [Pseudomonas aeruginosa]
ADKALRAKEAGAWDVINYQSEDIAARVKDITHGEKVNVVYDSVGQSTWLASLDSLKRRGLMVSFGNASGPVSGVNLGILNQKGGLYVTRPSLGVYVTNRAELDQASNALFDMILSGNVKVDVPQSQIFALKDAQKAHETIESRKTQGSSLLIP